MESYRNCPNCEGDDIGGRGDGDGHPGVPEGHAQLGVQAPLGVVRLRPEVGHALDDHEHIVDTDA